VPFTREPVRYGTSKIVKAPIEEVFDWCTDYREDDHKITGDPGVEKILEKTKERVMYRIDDEKDGRKMSQLTTVWLMPPKRWVAYGKGDKWDFIAEYTLTRKGKNTKLDIWIDEVGKLGPPQSLQGQEAWLSGHWDKILNGFYKEREAKKARRKR
jgi:hypothetical protein